MVSSKGVDSFLPVFWYYLVFTRMVIGQENFFVWVTKIIGKNNAQTMNMQRLLVY